jgi:membrane protein YdbS with pleckstrin-like domain
MTEDSSSTPITVAQAWSAPIVICIAGVGFAIWGFIAARDAYDVTAAIIIMIVAPVTASVLIMRGLVGLYQRHRWQGAIAILAGVMMFAGVVAGIDLIPFRGDDAPQW